MRNFHGRKFQIRTKPRLPISIDGEVLVKTPVSVEVATGAIEVAVPAAATSDSSPRAPLEITT